MSAPARAGALAALALYLPMLARAQARPAEEGGELSQAPAAPAFGEEIVVVGNRLRPSDATAATTVVDAQRYAGESKTVAELVTTAPGVAVNDYGGLGQLTTLSIRGSASDEVQVFLDGLPLNTAAGGGVDLTRIPHAWIDRIEIVRGAASASYGPGALAGAVDVVTRREAAGSWSASLSGGSFGTASASADGGLGGEHWGLLLASNVDRTEGDFHYRLDLTPSLPGADVVTLDRLHDASYSAGGLAKLWADVGPGRLDAVLQASGGARDLPGTAGHFTSSDGQADERLGLVTRLEEPLAEGVDLELGLTARQDRLDVSIAPYPQSRQDDLAAQLSGRLLLTKGPSALSLRLGAGTEELLVLDAAGHAWGSFFVAASDELSLGRLKLAPGLRFDEQGPFSGLSARLGASYALSRTLSLRASGGRAFRIPSFGELYLQQGLLEPNPALVPENSWSADAALVAEGPLGLFSVGAFTQLYSDLIAYEAVATGRMKPFNDGQADANGFEVELASAPVGPAAFSAALAYTYLATETLRGDALQVSKELPHRAPHRLFARVAAAPGPLEVHGELHFVAAQFGDAENSASQRIPAALTLNAGLGLRVFENPETTVNLEVRNLLDDISLEDGFGYPLPGRMVLVTLRLAGGQGARRP